MGSSRMTAHSECSAAQPWSALNCIKEFTGEWAIRFRVACRYLHAACLQVRRHGRKIALVRAQVCPGIALHMNLERFAGACGPALSTIDLLADQVALIDSFGTIVAVNRAWREFGRANGCDPAYPFIGTNYLDVCDRAVGAATPYAASCGPDSRRPAWRARGRGNRVSVRRAAEKRWFKLKATRSHAPGVGHLVAAHERIAEPQHAARQLRLQAHLLASVEQAVIATDLDGTLYFGTRLPNACTAGR